MSPENNLVERAFEIARGGSCRGLQEVRKMLKSAGFTDGQIEMHFMGPKLRQQLRSLCRQAQIATDAA